MFPNGHIDAAGFRVAGGVGEAFLCDAVEYGSLGRVELLHSRKGRQMRADAGARGEVFHERLQGGNQPEVVQHCGAQFAGEAVDDAD